jgi:NAD+ diphosphatase
MKDPVTKYSPQNVFKFCPACGSKNFHFRQDQSFFCDDCGFEFYINASAAVAALIEDDRGRLLFAKRAKDPMKGKLDLPGGFVDILETAEDAVKRELKEELNLKADKISFFTSQPNTYLYGEITYFTLDLAFICKVQNFETIAADDDVDGYQFIPLDEIDLDEIGLASIKKIVSLYLASKKPRSLKQ